MSNSVVLEAAQANGHGVHGLPSAIALSGFTAVNGDRLQNPSFRPSNVSIPPTTLPEAESIPRNTFGWRPDDSARAPDSEQWQLEASSNGKRKRSDSPGVHPITHSPSVEHRERSDSPKRRMTTSDSAIDVVSPTSTHRQDTMSVGVERQSPSPPRIGPYRRERSPMGRRNQGTPPPNRPTAETEAQLVASLQQFQQTQSVQETQSIRDDTPSEASSSPGKDDVDEDGVQIIEEGGKADDKDKRKRNFSNRTKSGCHTCRRRKKKCDERKPTCANCERGQFTCEGYGPKLPSGSKQTIQNRNVPLQSKMYGHPNGPPLPLPPPMQPSIPLPPGVWQHTRPEDGRSYSHWGRVATVPEPDPRQLNQATPVDSRRPSTQDGWTPLQPNWPPQDPKPTPNPPNLDYRQDRLPPPQSFPQMPSQQQAYAPDPRSHPPQQMQPLPPHPTSQHMPPAHVQPPHGVPQGAPHGIPHSLHQGFQHAPPPLHQTPTMLPEPYPPYQPPGPYPPQGPYHHHNTGPSFNSAASVSTSSSHRTTYPPYSGNAQEKKEKMMRGQPFDHYTDRILINDRYRCREALHRFNKRLEEDPWTSMEVRAQLFAPIIKPRKREPRMPEDRHYGPEGRVGVRFIVDVPFRCEYGYNIHIGDDTVVESGCYLQDSADISIGNRCIVSHNVKFYCLTASLDSNQRGGSRGSFLAGAIKVEDNVFIGGDSIIMPFVTIGKGAVIGAGSVVTRDVEEHTVVAGNPAKLIRSTKHGNVEKRHDFKIQKQQDNMMKRMVDYANNGYKFHNNDRMM